MPSSGRKQAHCTCISQAFYLDGCLLFTLPDTILPFGPSWFLKPLLERPAQAQRPFLFSDWQKKFQRHMPQQFFYWPPPWTKMYSSCTVTIPFQVITAILGFELNSCSAVMTLSYTQTRIHIIDEPLLSYLILHLQIWNGSKSSTLLPFGNEYKIIFGLL